MLGQQRVFVFFFALILVINKQMNEILMNQMKQGTILLSDISLGKKKKKP